MANELRCNCCGKDWTEHEGIQVICRRLKTAELEIQRQAILLAKARNHTRRAKR